MELLEKETLDKEEVAEIFKKLKRRANRPAWTGSNKRKPSKKGPVKAPVRLVKPEDTKHLWNTQKIQLNLVKQLPTKLKNLKSKSISS